VRTLGCKVNRVESDEIAAQLLGRGVAIGDEDDAAVIVINTCTVTGEADAKARKAVRHALGRQSEPVVVVTGCLAVLDADGLRAISPRVVVESDKARVPQAVADALGLTEKATADASVLTWGEGFRSRAMLKVQDGCDNFCAYCIVPYSRGVPRSVPPAEVVARARGLVEAGAAEIVLSGINVGRYSSEGADLADVVTAVAGTGVRRLRLSSVEPQHLTERLLGVLGSTPAVCAHLHLPLQSGSARVLAAMGRQCGPEEYGDRIRAARAAMPGLAVTTDVIAGFPSETDDDHAATLDFAKRVGFSKLHVFRYSVRSNTPAASMAQVAPQLRAKRAEELRGLGTAMRRDYLRRHAGCRAEMLVETAEEGIATGTTREYVRVCVRSRALKPGDVIDVVLGDGLIEPVRCKVAPKR